MKKYLISVLAVLLFAGQASAYWGTMEEKKASGGGGAIAASPFNDSYAHAIWVERTAYKMAYPVSFSCSLLQTTTKFIAATTPQTRIVRLVIHPLGSSTDFIRYNAQSAGAKAYGACWRAYCLQDNTLDLDLWSPLGVTLYGESGGGLTNASITVYQLLSATGF